MAKEPTRKSDKAPAGSPLSRGDLDKLDREIVRLMNERAKLTTRLVKQTGPLPASQLFSEVDARLTHLVELNKGPLGNAPLRAAMSEFYGGMLAIERKHRVAFLGPAYSYSHVATLERFGHGIEEVPVGTIPAVFEEVNRGHVDFGVVPIENSTDGRIADTLDMFTKLSVRICGEVKLRIHHNLLGKCARHEVAEVYSRPQALSQCRNWLAKHLPGARLVEVTSTSTAAQLAKDKPFSAAIASVQAGQHYGLNVLVPNMEDSVANVTRFVVIGHESAVRTGKDRMMGMFEVEHRPGGLADAISIFKRLKLNLTWIESFPIARPEGGYMFFIELEGHEGEARIVKAFDALKRKTLRLEILGSFARTEPVE